MPVRVLQASSHALGRGCTEPTLGPEVAVGSAPEQRFIDGVPFPLVLIPGSSNSESSPLDWRSWVESHQGVLSALLDRHGALLFRGFPLDGAEAFGNFMSATGVAARPYVGGAAPRCVLHHIWSHLVAMTWGGRRGVALEVRLALQTKEGVCSSTYDWPPQARCCR